MLEVFQGIEYYARILGLLIIRLSQCLAYGSSATLSSGGTTLEVCTS
jgi:hypothetical protein